MSKSIQNLSALLIIILGLSICLSTSFMSVSYLLLLLMLPFSSNFITNVKAILKNKYALVMLGFYLLYIIGIMWSPADLHHIKERLVKIIGYGLTPFLCVLFIDSKNSNLLLKSFIVGAVISALASILVFLFKHPIMMGPRDGMSLWVVFRGHLIHNFFLGIASSFLLRILIDKSYTKKQRIYCFIAYFLCVVDCLFIVFGRSGQITLIVMNIIALLSYFRWKGLLFSTLGLIVVLPSLWFLSPAVRQGIEAYQRDQVSLQQDVEQGRVNSVGLRKAFHANSIDIIKQSPFYGNGSASFHKVYNDYVIKYKQGIAITDGPHGDAYLIGVELGYLGVFIFLITLCTSFYVLIFNSIGVSRDFGLILLSGYVVGSMQNSFFTDGVTGLVFFIMMASIIMLSRKRKS